MESVRSVRLGVLIVLLQVLSSGFAESPPCSPGFDSELVVFKVHRVHLHRGRRLGTVVFHDCSGRTRTVFDSTDKRFQVDTDGAVKLQRQVTLHEGHKMFSVHAWDSKGKKHTVFVRVEHEPKSGHHHGLQEDTEGQSLSDVPVLEFSKSSGGLRRKKREWVIPPISFPENDRGPFPKRMVQIKSSYGKETKITYSITGEGADQPPVGLFTINKLDGTLFVTKPLDRETKDKYTLQAHAVSPEVKEDPMEIIVNVIDMNDNKPVFTQDPFIGSVPEASPIGFEFMTVTATDADDPETDNADVRYTITSQTPQTPNSNMFVINPVTGAIRVNSEGLDREKDSEYTLEIQAADMQGNGLVSMGKAVITVTDSNDHAPTFEKNSYSVTVPENKVGFVVVKMAVTDGDDPQSPAWTARFRIVSGNNGGFFNVSTGPNKQEGIVTTVKPLDYEENNKYTLLVVAENNVPFAKPLTTSTATVIVNVADVNEAPVFHPEEQIIPVPENLAVDDKLTVYTATDPDTAKNQKVIYRVGNDPAGWLKVEEETGEIKVKSPMDRESLLVKDDKYTALILAIDDDQIPATGTGTLVIKLTDVNDNAPVIEERSIRVCNKESVPVLLSVTDKDGPNFGAPYKVELQGDSRRNWSAVMNETKTGIKLQLQTSLEYGVYSVVMRVYDNGDKFQDSTVSATVCDCTGQDVQCNDKSVAGFGLSGILGILGAILALLVLVLLLLLFLRRKRSVKKEPLLADDDIRDNVYCYDEEGGGEDDQDYDLSVLHRGLDNRPDVFRNDVAPTFMPAPQYRPRPANPEEIGTFIDDNLKAADNDPTAPPYDSLLVFDYEGGGSEAGSLSSLNSSSSGDQDYDCVSRSPSLAKVLSSGFAESPPCSPGFDSELVVFKVHRVHLHRGRRLGTVVFNDCSGRTRTVFDSTDKRFQVDTDGAVKLQRQFTLHEGHKMFSVHAWDSKGKKHTVFVRVEHEPKSDHHHGLQEDTENNKSTSDHYRTLMFVLQSQSVSDVPVLEFPKSSGGLRRKKREWVIPPISIAENEKGPFPKQVVQIKSTLTKETKITYSITGEGADQPPVGLFTINKLNGTLYVTKPLDRETKDKYTLQAHAVSLEVKEDPMEIIVNVIDMNDNKPVFTQDPFIGSVPEASPIGFEFMNVTATDADDPETYNADVRYTIISQTPQTPNPNMFVINPVTGAIRVNSEGLDREKDSEYTLEIQAADMQGNGLVSMGKAIITVTDSNDHAPKFDKNSYSVTVPENKVGFVVVKMAVTDGDEPQSPAWAARFRIVSGNRDGFFNVSTGPNKQEGIVTTVKPLDYEENNKYTLLVVAENNVPFAKPLTTSTATVIVNVADVNEAPVFHPEEEMISKPENLAVDDKLIVYTATDPDTAKNQKVIYRVGNDPAGWLKVEEETGQIKLKSPMDRESLLVKDDKYTALILAIDDDQIPATGTGTLVIKLTDVNDNAPVIEERSIRMCNKESAPVLLSVTDKDGPNFGAPYKVELQGDSRRNWSAVMNETKTGIKLQLQTSLEQRVYSVVMRVYDNGNKFQDSTVSATVCDCTGQDVQCNDKSVAGILGILGAILALLVLVLLLLLFLRRKRSVKKEPLLAEDDTRDNVYYYDEEGGGEDDQDYDLGVLHRGLDNRPDVFRNDVAPTFMPAPQYRPRPANPEDIGTFIDDNLKAADNDPTAPPYDSLLVFDYEGGGSEAGSLSSLNSSSSGDQDYDCPFRGGLAGVFWIIVLLQIPNSLQLEYCNPLVGNGISKGGASGLRPEGS
ncbi:hypothetical protein NFI96_025503 [Prochilodus magdalenae]|nr:hypothetical protein NFI96_025503 [Prochilodus magdalenae]